MAHDEARLSLDGSSRPIVARIERQTDDALVVGRSLPFLRLGNRMVDGEGRAGSIANVAIRVSDGVPHLLVELAYDQPRSSEPPPPAVRARLPRRDPTLGYDARPARPSAPPRQLGLDDTNHDTTLNGSTGPLEVAFRPSLVPMPLPIPEASGVATKIVSQSRPRWRTRAMTFLAAIAAFAFWWVRPTSFLASH